MSVPYKSVLLRLDPNFFSPLAQLLRTTHLNVSCSFNSVDVHFMEGPMSLILLILFLQCLVLEKIIVPTLLNRAAS